MHLVLDTVVAICRQSCADQKVNATISMSESQTQGGGGRSQVDLLIT